MRRLQAGVAVLFVLTAASLAAMRLLWYSAVQADWESPVRYPRRLQQMDREQHTQRQATILLWSRTNEGKHGRKHWLAGPVLLNCSSGRYQCLLTGDRRLFMHSDAVVVNAKSKDLYSSLKHLTSLPRRPCQRWVLYKRDPPSSPPHLYSLLGLFNWTMTFLFSSDVRDFYHPVVAGKHNGGFVPDRDYLSGRDHFAVTVINSCVRERMEWVRQLKQHINITVLGRYGTHQECTNTTGSEYCLNLLRRHKFYLALEDAFCTDYISESVFHNALLNGVVPVILSGADTENSQVIPPGSYINVLNFQTPEHLSAHLNEVAGNPRNYSSYFKWHSHYSITSDGCLNMLEDGNLPRHGCSADTDDGVCGLCKKLYTDRTIKTYTRLESWLSFKQQCKPYPVRFNYKYNTPCTL